MDASVAFVGSGAALGIVLGSSMLGRRSEGTREQQWLALLLVGISAAMIAITLRHSSFRFADGMMLELVEYVTALAAGPVFAGYVRLRARGTLEMRPLLLVHFLPAAIAGLQILAAGGALLPFRYVMLVQVAYTALACREILDARRNGMQGARLLWPARFAGLAILVHVAQLVRTLFFDVSQLRNVVPITAVLGLEVLAILAVRESMLRAGASDREPPPVPPAAEPLRGDRQRDVHSALVQAIDSVMLRDRLWSDPELGLDRLAASVGSTPHRVSAALNAAEGGFFEYVSRWRLDAVRAAIEDSTNDIYTIDALAENAGFRSRSTFYAAFRRRFGVTPSQVRTRRTPASPASVSTS